MSVAQPAWLLLLLVPPAVWVMRRRRDRRALPHVSALAWYDEVPVTWRVRLRWLPAALRLLAFTTLVVALAGPMRDAPQRVSVRPGLDLLLLVDVSQSMRARDGQPDRLGSVLRLARQIVQARPRDRIGVLLFAGDHAIACPLTQDHEALLARLAAIETADSDEGTAVGAALVGGLARFQAARVAQGALIVASDGASNTGTPLPAEAAALAVQTGARVAAIGVGRDGLVPFPTELGIVQVPLGIDEVSLRSLAAAGGGPFVRADAAGSLDVLTAWLDRLEPSGRRVTSRRSAHAGTGLGLVGAALVLVELMFAGPWLRRWL
jgi:Ca-activated chloride channel family protein